MLCCHDTWSDLKLTSLKPSVKQCLCFSYGNVAFSYVNVAQTLSSSWFLQMSLLTYSGIVPLIYVNETISWYSALLQDLSQSFYGRGWIIWCHSKFYGIPFFTLTDCQWLYNIQLKIGGGHSFAPLWCLCQKPSLSPLYFKITWLHKRSEWSSLVSGPGLNSSLPKAKNPSVLSFSNTLWVVWTFFGIVVLWDGNEKRPLWTLLSFPTLLVYWVQHFNSIHLLGYDIVQLEFHYIH